MLFRQWQALLIWRTLKPAFEREKASSLESVAAQLAGFTEASQTSTFKFLAEQSRTCVHCTSSQDPRLVGLGSRPRGALSIVSALVYTMPAFWVSRKPSLQSCSKPANLGVAW